MSFEKVEYWRCNMCRTRGPQFEGTASEVHPEKWLAGEVDLGLGTSLRNVRVDIAICPDCRLEFLELMNWTADR